MTTTAAVEVTQSIDEMIGARVHHLMWRHRISQVQMAPHLGIKQSGLSKKLRGLAPWTVTDVYAAASALGVDPQDLLPRLDSNQQPFGYQPAQVIDLADYRRGRSVVDGDEGAA